MIRMHSFSAESVRLMSFYDMVRLRAEIPAGAEQKSARPFKIRLPSCKGFKHNVRCF